ncbi:MAG: 7-carboxy-7-deazaguanine synthase QueE [Candidatus Omnitrophica bacterium]|nr:7-carboxy-7-deazaguanine synthase QueE [Candidatus Omnitrophota bacterium]
MRYPPTTREARISEIFSSLQGEGTHLGERHLFIRFEECHIHCEYCDELDKPARVMTLDETVETVQKLEKEEGPHSFVSLTGGEPLLYLSFLSRLLLRLKTLGLRTYLETNGILWQALEAVIGWCDLIAMDLKPASVTKERSFLKEHARFLEIASTKEIFIKIILSKEIDLQEFQELIQLVKRIAPKTPVILQPISSLEDGLEGHEDPELMQLLGELQRMASRQIAQVRITPRLHRILKIR